MNLNWKYNQWAKKQNCEFNGIDTYISQNIEAEDIEIFSNILMPTVMEYKGGILFCGLDLTDEDFNSTKKRFDFCLLNCKSISDAERSANELRIYDIFFNTAGDSSEKTYQNITILIKQNWEFCLMKKYPNKKFIIEITGQNEQLGVTFYQQT